MQHELANNNKEEMERYDVYGPSFSTFFSTFFSASFFPPFGGAMFDVVG